MKKAWFLRETRVNPCFSRQFFLLFLITAVGLCSLLDVPVLASAYYDTWSEYKEANGVSDFTWNDVVDAMDEALSAAVDSYKSGDAETAKKQISDAKNGYWGASGLKIEMQKHLPSASKKTTESDFLSCNSIIKNEGSADELSTAKDVLIADLRLSANKLDGVEEETEIAEETDTAATAL
ncbi:MAG: hypothetical protein IJ679_02085, partial [Lachnospiraceae bacterium]|nr:hypothetical protein [Lachnospiraceae bacterium]